MHARKNAHWHVPWIVAHEHLVNLQDGAEFLIERLSRNVREIEINLVLAVDPKAIDTNLKDLARGNITWHQIAVSRILLFEKIPTLFFGDRGRRSLIAFRARYPDASAFAASRFAHQAQLVIAGNRSWMHLNEFAVRVLRALLITGRDRAAGAHHRIGRLAKDQSWPTGRDDDGIRGKCFQFQRPQVHRSQAAATLITVEHQGQHGPGFIFLNPARHFVTPHLFIERVQELLARRSAGKCGAMMFGAAEAAKVQESFLRARKGNSHAIEEVDDCGGHFAHRFRGWLIREKVPAVNGVVKMFPRRIAFTLSIDCAVDTTLRADRMRALDRHDGKEIDVMTGFSDLHRRRETGEPAADYRDFDLIPRHSQSLFNFCYWLVRMSGVRNDTLPSTINHDVRFLKYGLSN